MLSLDYNLHKLCNLVIKYLTIYAYIYQIIKLKSVLTYEQNTIFFFLKKMSWQANIKIGVYFSSAIFWVHKTTNT